MQDSVETMELRLLLEAIYHRYQYDFRDYSHSSLRRRLSIARDKLKCRSFSELQHRILHEPESFPVVLPYLTVQVSDLFRDPEYFLALRQHVIPHLRTYPSLRVWVAGCSTGEELYSLAILFREEGLEKRTIFYGTDINPESLQKAQSGTYDLERMQQFTENHRLSGARTSLSDYYTAAYGSAVFDKSLRERLVFSDHSLATDSVFGEMHLISCRNVLIYFRRKLQDRAIGLFRDSLARKCFLGLGLKESLQFSQYAGAFREFERATRIYQKEEAV